MKTFKSEINPVLQFISHSNTEEIVNIEEKNEKKGSETKSKRLQLLVKPSIYEKIKREAQKSNTSVNDIINKILEKF